MLQTDFHVCPFFKNKLKKYQNQFSNLQYLKLLSVFYKHFIK